MRVIVVGGGLIGTATALALCDAGVDVVLIERGVLGAEASWAAAGILAPQVEVEGPGPFLALSRFGLTSLFAWCARLQERSGVDVGLRRTGTLDVACDDAEEQALRGRIAWQRSERLSAEWLGVEEVRRQVPGIHGDVRGAAYFADEGSLDPRRLFEAMSGALRKAGSQLQVIARRIERLDARERKVHLVDAPAVVGDVVVVCAGAWTAAIPGVPVAADAVFPVRGQIAELCTPPPGTFQSVVFGRGGYLVPRSDGRVLCGSTVERVGFDKAVTAAGLTAVLTRAMSLIPDLGAAAVSSTWSGLRPGTPDQKPLLGEASPGVWVASGHYRNGILLAAASAEIVTAGILGRSLPLDIVPFSPLRFSRA